MKTYFAFDLETTGIDVANDEPVEISFSIVRDEGPVRPTTFLIKTARDIHEKAQAVHGISKEELVAGLSPSLACIVLDDVFKRVNFDGLLAFNGFKFDIPMLTHFIRRSNPHARTAVEALSVLPVEDPALWYLAEKVFSRERPVTREGCAQVAAEWVPKGTKFNLGHLCGLYGIEHRGAHSAAGDLMATVELWRKMKSGPEEIKEVSNG